MPVHDSIDNLPDTRLPILFKESWLQIHRDEIFWYDRRILGTKVSNSEEMYRTISPVFATVLMYLLNPGQGADNIQVQ